MSGNSRIEWTEATWSPVTGCTRASEGCLRCYIDRTPPFRMERRRFSGPDVGATTGVRLHPDRLDAPLKWRKPRRIFVCSLADLFHDDVPDEYIARAFAAMALAPHHTFQVLTKRHGRMRALLNALSFRIAVLDQAHLMVNGEVDGVTVPHQVAAGYWQRRDAALRGDRDSALPGWPLPGVWLGVSVENQKWANARIPALLDTPAAVRWLSCEPLLGPVNLGDRASDLNWVVAGGESGPNARPMHPAWARSLRDQCVSAGVPFFLKQWGEWGPAPWRVDQEPGESVDDYRARAEAACATHAYATWAHRYGHEPLRPDHKPWSAERTSLGCEHAPMRRWGKKAAGRVLDGRTWDEYPTVAEA